MSAVSDLTPVSSLEPELAPYRAICRTAVISALMAAIGGSFVVFAVVSMWLDFADAVWLGGWGASFAFAAIVLGFAGIRTVRRYPNEYTGGGLARAGFIGGLLLFAIGVFAAMYIHSTEVPDGYSRISFWDLQPDPDQPELPIAPQAFELNRKPIFIKGYMHPGVASMGKVNHFILVPDMGTCCFGGQPKPTDMIEVYVPDGKERVAYSPRRLKLTGTFLLADRPTQSLGLNNVWYHMEIDQVK